MKILSECFFFLLHNFFSKKEKIILYDYTNITKHYYIFKEKTKMNKKIGSAYSCYYKNLYIIAFTYYDCTSIVDGIAKKKQRLNGKNKS